MKYIEIDARNLLFEHTDLIIHLHIPLIGLYKF